jgi:hypothetical protein
MSDEMCIYCDERPATHTTRRYWRRSAYPIAVCELCKAALERKHSYMPCVIGERYEAMTLAEQAQVLRETYWADNITKAEWPVVLRHDGVKAYVRSKLKKKAVGWVVALSRMVWLNPEFGAQVLRDADALYRKQIEEDPPIPWVLLADLIEAGWFNRGLEGWLQPLRNLREYSPDQLASLAEYMAASEQEKHRFWLPKDGNAEDDDEEAA